MKKSEMTPEQIEAKRLYDKEAKRASRAKQKIEKQKLNPVRASFYEVPVEQRARLDKHVELTLKTIAAELNLKFLPDLDEYMAVAVASVLFGFEHDITQVVVEPEGVLVGGYFPDGSAVNVIDHIHRFPDLLKSPIFAELYKKFLRTVRDWSKRNKENVVPEFIDQLKQEIAGTYALPEPKQKPKPEPLKIKEVPSSVTDSQILEQGRIKLLNQIDPGSQTPQAYDHYPNVTPAVRRFLAGL